MKKSILFILFLAVKTILFAQEYYPEGTKWTEIRLDTLKYYSWYSKVGNEWMPNFETIEYCVKGKYTSKYGDKFKCVYTSGQEWTDSLTLMIRETDDNRVMVGVPVRDYDGELYVIGGVAYQFDWNVGKGLYYQDIVQEQTTYMVRYEFYYGMINEIKEEDFGGVRLLRYVDLDGKAPEGDKYDNPKKIDTKGGRIIQGIGITEWNSGECLFGPPEPYFALRMFNYHDGDLYPDHHYRSMLVHFERNGEVLYDVWPEEEATDRIKSIYKAKTPMANTFFDLQGRRLNGQPQNGIFIKDRKKYVK